jgi:hexosaminidase
VAGQGELKVNENFTVGATLHSPGTRLQAAQQRFLLQLDHMCGGVLRTASRPMSGRLSLTMETLQPAAAVQGLDEDESYTLTVTSGGATLRAPNELGVMHGLQTVLQLVEVRDGACVLPAVTVTDAPRFAWRGLHLDVSRHFEPIAVVKRQLDAMAAVKLNVFHWHLSDDQGFRAESKRYPRFTAVASNGEFYTQDEMRDVVAYARDRGIRVVPEFDMPGHTTSWLLAYPEYGSGEHITSLPLTFGTPQAELDPSNEATMKMIDALVGEMGTIFPDAYFHIGGDETEGKGWLENPRIAEWMKRKGFSKPADVQAYFNQRLLQILTKHGKKMIGWDEILNPALPKSIVVQSWRGEASLASGAQEGYQGILSAPYYLDGQKTAAEMFAADPVPADTKLTPEQQKLILGGEVCMWAEQINSSTVDSRIWPRTAAIAERFWSPQADRDPADMYRRLRRTSLELDSMGLEHISGPERMRRSLVESANPEMLNIWASVLEPVSFGERYDGQKTDAYTSLNRLVDAVVADPPSREEIAMAVDRLVEHPGSPDTRLVAERLRARFEAWQQASPWVTALSAWTPRLSDAGDRAAQLGALARVGLEALSYLEEGVSAPQGWQQAKVAVLDDAAKPSALVRWTMLPSLRKLVDAAGAGTNGGTRQLSPAHGE